MSRNATVITLLFDNNHYTIPVINGNILSSGRQMIVQQVNCRGVMGKGLAASILEKYPNVKTEYLRFQKEQVFTYGSPKKLLGIVNYVRTHDNTLIANVFGQNGVRKSMHDTTQYTDVPALLHGLKHVLETASVLNYTVAIPYGIGCGLGGADWNEVSPLIEQLFSHSDLNVAFYKFN